MMTIHKDEYRNGYIIEAGNIGQIFAKNSREVATAIDHYFRGATHSHYLLNNRRCPICRSIMKRYRR